MAKLTCEMYMVLADGWWNEAYGSYVDFIGIYYSKEQAEEVVKQQPEEIRESCRVVPVIVGETHNMRKLSNISELGYISSSNEYACGFRLGGYVE